MIILMSMGIWAFMIIKTPNVTRSILYFIGMLMHFAWIGMIKGWPLFSILFILISIGGVCIIFLFSLLISRQDFSFQRSVPSFFKSTLSALIVFFSCIYLSHFMSAAPRLDFPIHLIPLMQLNSTLFNAYPDSVVIMGILLLISVIGVSVLGSNTKPNRIIRKKPVRLDSDRHVYLVNLPKVIPIEDETLS